MKKKTGFALLSSQKRRQLAAKGGRRAQALKTGHRWSVDAARIAGRKGAAARNSRRLEQVVGEGEGQAKGGGATKASDVAMRVLRANKGRLQG